MANELIYATGTQLTLQSSGASAASNVFITGTSSSGSIAASQMSAYTGLDLVLTASMSSAVSSASNYFACYARPMNIDGTNDAPTPSAAYRGGLVGIFLLASNSIAGTQTSFLPDVPVSWADQEFYLENLTNSPVGAGWTLKATPKTVKPL